MNKIEAALQQAADRIKAEQRQNYLVLAAACRPERRIVIPPNPYGNLSMEDLLDERAYYAGQIYQAEMVDRGYNYWGYGGVVYLKDQLALVNKAIEQKGGVQ